jgi:hypothetical protein
MVIRLLPQLGCSLNMELSKFRSVLSFGQPEVVNQLAMVREIMSSPRN